MQRTFQSKTNKILSLFHVLIRFNSFLEAKCENHLFVRIQNELKVKKKKKDNIRNYNKESQRE